jgi:hypothetical protein
LIADLSSAITRLASGLYTITRRTTTIVNGRRQLGNPTTFANVPCSVQPTDGPMVKQVPEGVRLEDTKVVFTAFHMQLAEGTDKEPDRIQLSEGPFMFIGQAEWDESGGFYKCLIQKVRE